MVVNSLKWVLGTELGYSERSTHFFIFNHRFIFSAPKTIIIIKPFKLVVRAGEMETSEQLIQVKPFFWDSESDPASI